MKKQIAFFPVSDSKIYGISGIQTEPNGIGNFAYLGIHPFWLPRKYRRKLETSSTTIVFWCS